MSEQPLYERDFYAWAMEQAAALRQAAAARVNLPLDFANLAEEIESMGRSDWNAVQGALARIIEHLLKLEFSPAANPRPGWRETIGNHRIQVQDRVEQSPSLEGRIDLPRAYRMGRGYAALGLKEYDHLDAAILPAECPYTLDQIRDETWWPASRHGLA